MDLAVVIVSFVDRSNKSNPFSGEAISTLGIAQGPEPPIGAKVYAIGSPKGLEASLSEGIISGRREVAEEMWHLQTTTPISPGSSGGPLLDSTGQVVGVTTAGLRGGQNLNFAIPASQVLAFLKGPCNSRPLWRGTGIEEEEKSAYYCSTFPRTVNLSGIGRSDRRLWDADKKIQHRNYDDALRDLGRLVPSEFGKNEYLVHYTIGRAAGCRGAKRALAGAATAGDVTAKGLAWTDDQAVAGRLHERSRNDNDEQLAEKSFRRSIELTPKFSPAYEQLADCLLREGRFDEGLLVADSLIKLVPRCATAYKIRGGLHAELKRHLEALADFETAAELGGSDPETYQEIGGQCIALEENAKAVDAYEAAIQFKLPDSLGGEGLCRYSMGIAYKRMGKYEQALPCFEKAKSLGIPPAFCDAKIAKCRAQMKGDSGTRENEASRKEAERKQQLSDEAGDGGSGPRLTGQ